MRTVMSADPAKRARVHSRPLLGYCFVALTVLAPTGVRAADSYEVTIERGVPVKMRDGVTLRADICRPKAEGKFPVLLTRTPYDKNGAADFCLKAAARGYVVVAQDVRGRYASEGDWYPFKYESPDGLRYGRVGGCASLFEREGRDVRWLLRRRDAISRGNCQAASSGGNLSQRHGVQ